MLWFLAVDLLLVFVFPLSRSLFLGCWCSFRGCWFLWFDGLAQVVEEMLKGIRLPLLFSCSSSFSLLRKNEKVRSFSQAIDACVCVCLSRCFVCFKCFVSARNAVSYTRRHTLNVGAPHGKSSICNSPHHGRRHIGASERTKLHGSRTG